MASLKLLRSLKHFCSSPLGLIRPDRLRLCLSCCPHFLRFSFKLCLSFPPRFFQNNCMASLKLL